MTRTLFATLLSLALGFSEAQAQDTQLESLRDSARAERRDAGAQRAYGLALLQTGDYREADRVLRVASRLSSDSLESLYDVARVAFAQNEYRKARAACRLLERAERNAALTHVCRARAFLIWNRSGRAFEELEAAQAASGAEFETQLALGDAHRLRGEVAESELAYRAAIALSATRAEPHAGLGHLYLAARRNEDATRALRAARAIDSSDPDTNLALAALVRGDEGRRLVTAAITRRPGDASAQVLRGQLAFSAEDLDEAELAFRAALEVEALAAAYVGLGDVLLAKGDQDGAEAALQSALALVPSNAEVVLSLGRLAESRGQSREAFRSYRHAADLNPGNPNGLLLSARLALSQRRATLATGFLDRLLQRHANLGPALELYGDALASRNDRAGARGYYERALGGTGDVDQAAIRAKMAGLTAPARDNMGRATAP
ncbi:MAG: tetratricopeptide (TPR) repeat protein [Polyangiales bacterium]|jgi:tetratricopeptide (TPR) repeat protein